MLIDWLTDWLGEWVTLSWGVFQGDYKVKVREWHCREACFRVTTRSRWCSTTMTLGRGWRARSSKRPSLTAQRNPALAWTVSLDKSATLSICFPSPLHSHSPAPPANQPPRPLHPTTTRRQADRLARTHAHAHTIRNCSIFLKSSSVKLR